MPKVTIDDRTVEVEAGTNLIDAALKAGVHIPHYCYHPRLSVVGQCRMCLVKVEGMPKLQAGCSTQVMKDGMVVRSDVPEVKEAQKGMMEFLLINHPLDCPICDQAGECALQDYSFKHGAATSRFQFEDKRTYPGRERIPLGGNVMLNMNRCIQCTRCVRFTQEVAGTGELGFFNRGARTEIGTFPGRQLDNPLATCVVDICPVGALTSTRFRFAERVFYLDKKPSLCTGCDIGCNITIEHRRGIIKRYKPRFNPDVNDYWMCDFGRATFERYRSLPRLAAPRLWRDPRHDASGPGPQAMSSGAAGEPASWKEALDLLARRLHAGSAVTPDASGAFAASEIAVLGSGFLSNEEAYLFSQLASAVGARYRAVAVDAGPPRFIPNLAGGVHGSDAAPNRRGAELAGLAAARRGEGAAAPGNQPASAGNGASSTAAPADSARHQRPATDEAPTLRMPVPAMADFALALDLEELFRGAGGSAFRCLIVCDSDFGAAAHDPAVVERLRRVPFLVVFGWADTPLARAADVALPVATHAERSGTFVNAEWRVQRFEAAFPPPGQARPAVEVLCDLLSRFDPRWAELAATATTAKHGAAPAVFERLAFAVPGFAGLTWHGLSATGAELELPAAHAAVPAGAPHLAEPEDTAAGI